MEHSAAVEEAWQYHRRWSRIADRTRRRIDRFRSLSLALLVAGAVAGAVAAQQGWPRPVTVVAAGIASGTLALAGFVQQRWLSATEVGRWSSARAASETLKAEVFRYLVNVAPYDGTDRDEVLKNQVDKVQDRANRSPGRLDDFLPQRPDDRPMPMVDSFESYTEDRARAQATWHESRIADHRGRAARLRGFEIATALVGFLLGAIAAATGTTGLAGWIAVTTTVAGALVAHGAATNHERIAAGYALTADLLARLIRRLPPSPDEQARTRFVADVESRLAAQNSSWVELFPTS
jgi:hypothetical protein